MVDVSVVICAYTFDRWEELKAAVASVRAQSHQPREIIISVDGNEPLCQRAALEIEGAMVVLNTKLPGLSGTRMTGTAVATAPVIAFLDDDAIAEENWLEELLDAYQDDRVLGAGGYIEPLWISPRPAWFAPEYNWVVGCTYDGMQVRDQRVRNLMGANMSVRADVLRRAGGFTTALGRREQGRSARITAQSCEETEFCIRASRLYPKGVWAYRAKARVKHRVLAQRTTWRYFVYRCAMEGTAKAVLIDLTGAKAGLGSARHYVLKVLSKAVLREIGGALHGRLGSVGRAGAICAGLAITSFAYARTRLALTREKSWKVLARAPATRSIR
jgi:glycosyltransferase involved in cell wall biosynthesis